MSEKLHQNTFWLGRGGSVTHTISGIDIALWDLLGKATGQPVGRLLGGRYRDRVRPYASLLMEEPAPLAATVDANSKARDSARSRSAGGLLAASATPWTRRSSSAARDGGRTGVAVDGRRRRERCVLEAGLQVGPAHRADAGRLRRGLVRGAVEARCPARLRASAAAARRCPSPAARCSRGVNRSSPGWRPAPSTWSSPT